MADADEMILAGSRPTHKNPIDALHSRTSFVLAIDCAIIVFFLYQIFGQFALIPGLFFLAVWSGYRNKSDWAYWFVPMIIGLLTVFFCLVLAINVMALLSGSVQALILVLLLAYAIYSSVRFIRIHFHPVYRMGYSGHSVYEESAQLAQGEMLAACPSCLAVLAVNPILLSPEDKCPHCGSSLVLGEEE